MQLLIVVEAHNLIKVIYLCNNVVIICKRLGKDFDFWSINAPKFVIVVKYIVFEKLLFQSSYRSRNTLATKYLDNFMNSQPSMLSTCKYFISVFTIVLYILNLLGLYIYI